MISSVVNKDVHGRLHSTDDAPSVESEYSVQWHHHGLYHRDNGPAIINKDNGSMMWYYMGLIHRWDGPAYEVSDDTGIYRESQWFFMHKRVGAAFAEWMSQMGIDKFNITEDDKTLILMKVLPNAKL